VSAHEQLLRRAYEALEAIQERTGSTLLEMLEGAEGFRSDDDQEALADLLDQIQRNLGEKA
jgi:hypothetical protein